MRKIPHKDYMCYTRHNWDGRMEGISGLVALLSMAMKREIRNFGSQVSFEETTRSVT